MADNIINLNFENILFIDFILPERNTKKDVLIRMAIHEVLDFVKISIKTIPIATMRFKYLNLWFISLENILLNIIGKKHERKMEYGPGL